MKKIILIICLAAFGIVSTHAQTCVIVSRPTGHIVTPAVRTVIVSRPVRRVRQAVIVRPFVTVVRPAARRSMVIVQR